MIQIQHLTITHTKDLRELVHDLNLTIATGEKVAIIGEEGNGKSSLLTLLVNPFLPLTFYKYLTYYLSLLWIFCIFIPILIIYDVLCHFTFTPI